MIYLVSWYVQDFFWVLGSGKVLVPEFFLLALVFLSLFRFEDGVTIFWAAFLGGVLWDLRWIGFPGISSLFYIGTLMIVRWIWYSIPVSGRTVSFFGFLFWCANVPTALGRIFLWGARGTDIFYTHLFQQSYILPIVLLACAAYAWRLKNRDV
jgi:rod shape-determining protein MreD